MPRTRQHYSHCSIMTYRHDDTLSYPSQSVQTVRSHTSHPFDAWYYVSLIGMGLTILTYCWLPSPLPPVNHSPRSPFLSMGQASARQDSMCSALSDLFRTDVMTSTSKVASSLPPSQFGLVGNATPFLTDSELKIVKVSQASLVYEASHHTLNSTSILIQAPPILGSPIIHDIHRRAADSSVTIQPDTSIQLARSPAFVLITPPLSPQLADNAVGRANTLQRVALGSNMSNLDGTVRVAGVVARKCRHVLPSGKQMWCEHVLPSGKQIWSVLRCSPFYRPIHPWLITGRSHEHALPHGRQALPGFQRKLLPRQPIHPWWLAAVSPNVYAFPSGTEVWLVLQRKLRQSPVPYHPIHFWILMHHHPKPPWLFVAIPNPLQDTPLAVYFAMARATMRTLSSIAPTLPALPSDSLCLLLFLVRLPSFLATSIVPDCPRESPWRVVVWSVHLSSALVTSFPSDCGPRESSLCAATLRGIASMCTTARPEGDPPAAAISTRGWLPPAGLSCARVMLPTTVTVISTRGWLRPPGLSSGAGSRPNVPHGSSQVWWPLAHTEWRPLSQDRLHAVNEGNAPRNAAMI